MASPSDVRDILVDVSDKGSLPKEPSIKEILDRATHKLRVRIMHAKYGPPTQWCRGNPASFRRASTDWYVIGWQTVEQWRSTWPHAFPTESAGHTLEAIARDVWTFAYNEWFTYGTGLQQQVEAKFESELAERHREVADEIAKEEARKEQARATAEREERNKRRIERAIEAARQKLGVTHGDWTRVDWQERERLVNAELAAMRGDDDDPASPTAVALCPSCSAQPALVVGDDLRCLDCTRSHTPMQLGSEKAQKAAPS